MFDHAHSSLEVWVVRADGLYCDLHKYNQPPREDQVLLDFE